MVPSKENPRLNPSGHFYTRTLFQHTITSCLEQWNDLLPVTLPFSLFTPWPAYPLKNLSQVTAVLHWQSWNGFPCSQVKSVTLPEPSLPKASPTTPLPAPGWRPACPPNYWSMALGIALSLGILTCHPLGQECLSFFEPRSSLLHLLQVLPQKPPSPWDNESVPGQPTLNCNNTLHPTPFPLSLPNFSP